MGLWEEIQRTADQIAFADIAREESKRTLFIHPDEADRIRWWVDQMASTGVLKVVESSLVPPGNMYVVDEQALDASMRESLSKMRFGFR